MDDKKQIEEMARIICGDYNNGCCENDGWICNYNCVAHNERATALYEQGYRKIPEGSVVLSKEEYENITDNIRNDIAIDTIRAIFEFIPWNSNTDSFEKGILKLIHEYSLDMKIEEKARKRAVKEFAEMYKDHVKNYTGMFTDEGFMVELQAVLSAVDFIAAKEFGVEVKDAKTPN